MVTVSIYGDQPVANSPLSITIPDFSVVPPEANNGVRPMPLLLAPPPAVRQLVTSPHTPSPPNTLLPPASNLLPPATPKTPAGVVIQSLLSTNNVQQPSKMSKTQPGQSPPRRRYNQPASVTVGERVVAKWSGNGQYYEGTIFLVNQDSAIVMFKEGGTSETVALSDIQVGKL